MDKKNYVVAVDIGSSEVVIAVGSLSAEGGVKIETIVTEHCEGVVAGLVDNSQLVTDSLRRAKERAEQELGIVITDAYVSISGKFVRCARYTDHVFVDDNEACISQRDVNALSERMRSVKSVDGEMIMDFYPINYKGTTGGEMKNPVGSYSPQLSSTYNFILCEHMAKERLSRVFMGVGIKIQKLYAGAAVIGDAVLNSDEKEEGVAVVDIGSGVTDVAIYYGGVLRYIAIIPMGGAVVNSDIRAYAGTIPAKMVESLKCRYGSALVDQTPDEIIQIKNGNRIIKPIQRLNLAAVIEARMSDLVDYVWKEIRDAGFAKKLAAGIVLTGGGAALANTADLFQKITGQQVRVSCAEMGISTEDMVMAASPDKTMAVALMLRGASVGAVPVRAIQDKPTPIKPQPAEQPAVVTPAPEEPKKPAPEEVEQPVNEPPVQEPEEASDSWEDEVPYEDEDVKPGNSGLWGRIKNWIDGAFSEQNQSDEEDY